jgi:hypothetical protein
MPDDNSSSSSKGPALSSWAQSLKQKLSNAFQPVDQRVDADLAAQGADPDDQLHQDENLSEADKLRKVQKGFLGND